MATRKTAKKAPRKAASVRKPVAKRTPARKTSAPRRKAAPATKPRKSPATDALAQLAGVGSEAVRKATGKAWDQWLRVLDQAGAANMPHKAIAQMLSEKYAVPGWWAQMVTVGYEQARGLRAMYQKADGFAANASKTIGASLERVYDAWSDPRLREYWLPGAPLQVRRSMDGKSMRITWTLGDSSVGVNFSAKGPDRSTVQVEHRKLADAGAVAAQKAYWASGLERLQAWLEAGRK